MPSRLLPPPGRAHPHLLAAAVATSAVILLIAVLLLALYLYLTLLRRSQTLPFPPSPTPPLRCFSHRQLRAATRRFSPSLALGRGASAAVFRAVLPDGKSVAVKRLAPSSLDREFQNELTVLAGLLPSPSVVALLGYCLEGRHRLLVYEYMCNGSLQEALFGPRSSDLTWERRFQIVLDIADALAFLHLECEPPIIHGDIKPSNVLLGPDFRAKICDFGLSRFNSVVTDPPLADLFSQELGPSQELGISAPNFGYATTSPKGKEAAVEEMSGSLSPLVGESRTGSKRQWGKDWWWKQEDSGELCSKDYVTEWIGSQICPSSNPDLDGEMKSPVESGAGAQLSSSSSNRVDNGKRKMAAEGSDGCDTKGREMREWWKEEYFAEISNKGSSKHHNKGLKWFRGQSGHGDDSSNATQPFDISFRKGWKKKRVSAGSNEWSGDLSTTTSMRGTVCYIAPEFGGCGNLMEKSDIYSFGVLILVIVSGRRPLHVLTSPMKLEKANLISWCRQLVQTGNILDLVDERLKDLYSKEQASLCINLALRCLQRSPESRPDSGEIVKILRGETELPVVPFEFSPSPPIRPSSKSRRKTSLDPE